MLEIGRPVSPSFLFGGENQTSSRCFGSARSCKKIQDDSLRNIIAWHRNTRSKAGTSANGRGKVRDVLDALGSTGEILASCAIDRYVSNTVIPRIYITVRNPTPNSVPRRSVRDRSEKTRSNPLDYIPDGKL